MTSKLLFSTGVLLLFLLPTRAIGTTSLIMFDSEYCTWCQMWEEEIGGIYHLTTEGCQAPLQRFDFDRGEYPALVAIAEPVIYTPTFVLLYNQQEVGRITGYPGADFFWHELDELLKNGIPDSVRLAVLADCGGS